VAVGLEKALVRVELNNIIVMRRHDGLADPEVGSKEGRRLKQVYFENNIENCILIVKFAFPFYLTLKNAFGFRSVDVVEVFTV